MSGSPTPPATFDPLDSRNGVPGDAGELTALARRYADTAAEIEAQAASLARLTSRSQEAWKGRAADNFVEVAGDLAERIGRARGRYEAAARALGDFAGRLEEAQATAYAAVRRAQTAEQSQRALQSTAPVPPGAGATPEQLLHAGEEQRLHDRAVTTASEELGSARRDYAAAVGDYHRAAEDAARTLRTGRDDDLADTWWDRHAGWIDAVLDALSVIAVGLVILAVVLAVIATGGVALVPLIATLLKASTALGLLGLAGRTGLWATDNGSGKDVLWELAGVLTLGTGKAVSVGARGLSGAASRVSARRTGFAPTAAELAAVPHGRRWSRGFALGEESIARHVSEVHRIARDNGGGLEMWAFAVSADAMVVTGVAAPGTLLAAKTAKDVRAEYLSGQDAADRANRTRIVQQWSMPLLHARAR